MKTVKDYTVTTSYGFFECPDCGSRFYRNGAALHNTDCPTWRDGYKNCVYHVGPNCPEFATAEEVAIDPAYALVIENADVPAEEAKG